MERRNDIWILHVYFSALYFNNIELNWIVWKVLARPQNAYAFGLKTFNINHVLDRDES
jgi:hypothetical protein